MRRWVGVLSLLLAGCGGSAREVVLLELVNDQVGRTRIALHHIDSRQVFREGKRVGVDFGSLLILDAGSKTIKTELVSVGDEVTLDGKRWTVVRVEPGNSETRGRVVLAPADD